MYSGRVRVWLTSVAVLAGCGRIGFDVGLDTNPDSATDASELPDVDLMFWYPMDSLDGARVLDASRYARHGICGDRCPMIEPGVRGAGAYRFGGANIIRVGTGADLVLDTATLALWIRIDALPTTGNMHVVSKPFDVASNHNSWELYVDSMSMLTGGGDSITGALTRIPITLGTWRHVAMIWSNSTLEIYFDAVAISSVTPFTIAYDMQDVILGGELDFGMETELLIGAIDDARLYRRVLTPAEIAQLAVGN